MCCFCSPEFQSKNTGKREPKKKGKSTIPTRNSKCCFCSPKFQSKNAGNREPTKKKKAPFQQEIQCAASVLPNFNLKTLERGSQKKRRRNHSNMKFYVPLLFSRISI